MNKRRKALLCLAAVGALLVSLDGALAQKLNSRGPAPSAGTGRVGGDGGGFRGGGWGGTIPGVLMAIPQVVPQGGQVIDDSADDLKGPRRQSARRRTSSGVPPINERRYMPDEVVIELPDTVSAQTLDAFQRRSRLVQVERLTSQLTGTTLYRWRIPDRRTVPTMVRQLETDTVVVSAQPNYLVRLQQTESKTEGDPVQYELAKLHLLQAHVLAKGDNILVAVVDSGIDASHPDLSGAVAQAYDALDTPMTPHKHGTAIAGLIAAHGRLMGSAPGARILAIRAFDPAGASAEGSTFGILKSLDWAAKSGARVINMSFAGPADPAIHRSLEAAAKKNIVLIAAAGNAGEKSPPLYPAADANVIAVTATDADDKLFEPSNRGSHIAIAAPGAQIMVAIPDGGYEVSSGTSYAAAEVAGIVALMLERKSDLTPDRVRAILQSTAKDLGPKGRDVMFGAGLADAYGALIASSVPVTAAMPRTLERASTGAR
jgi:subtilisin family serine protease